MHEQYMEINASRTNHYKSSSCPLMVRAKTAGELTNRESQIKSGKNQTRITSVHAMRYS